MNAADSDRPSIPRHARIQLAERRAVTRAKEATATVYPVDIVVCGALDVPTRAAAAALRTCPAVGMRRHFTRCPRRP